MSQLKSLLPRSFGVVYGGMANPVLTSQQLQLNFVRGKKIERRSKRPPIPKHEKHIPFDPKYIPVKYHVAPPRHCEFKYKPRVNRDEQPLYSSGDCSRPLDDDPVVQDYPQKLPDGGLRYYGFVYYPQDPENIESLSEEEISPLFMVRITKQFGKFEKPYSVALKELGFPRWFKTGDVVIVKNIPEVNMKLYLVKHLVEIKPVKLPRNLPLDADPQHCRFTEDAELLYNPEMRVTPEQLQEPEDLAMLKQDSKLVNKVCAQRWIRAWEIKFV